MQPAQSAQQTGHEGQSSQYSVPPAPTFASLGAHSMPFTGTLGSLAQGHQPPQQSGQGLSAAIPPSAYLMAQAQAQAQLQAQAQGSHAPQMLPPAAAPAAEKRAPKKEEAAFGLILPLHKVKRLIKSENTVKAVSGEASFAIARATELLLQQLVDRAYQRMVAEGRESITYDDVASVVSKWPAADFLRDIVPQTMSVSELIEMAKREDEAA